MSSTFSANAGSFERLKVRTRWGSMRWARQIRWIVRSARPTRSATARPVQCVTSPGGSEQVMARTWATVSGGTGGLPGGRVLSRSSPWTPSSAKRCCQRHTAGRLTPTRRATSSTGRRSSEHRMMRARWTCLCIRFRSATRAVRRSRSPALRRMLEVWAMRPRLAHLPRTVNPQIASVHYGGYGYYPSAYYGYYPYRRVYYRRAYYRPVYYRRAYVRPVYYRRA